MSVLNDLKNHTLTVYLWDTVYSTGEPGHASVATEEQHFGFWPHREFTVLDIPFSLSVDVKKSLQNEMYFSPNEPVFSPDKYYKIAVTEEQYTKVNKEIGKQSENIKTGKTRYTWLTSVNNFVRKALDCFQNSDRSNLENCSTIATKILNAGGIPVKANSCLWGISPSELGLQLDRLISEKKIDGNCCYC